MTQDYFSGVVGQETAKNKLSFYLKNHLENGSPMPNILLTGSKGDGKTYLARKIGKNLPDFGDKTRAYKKFYTLDGPVVTNLNILFEDICSKFANGDDYATIFVDEAHDLPPKVQTALLRITEPTKEGITRYTYNDMEYVFDSRKITWIFATTEDDKIFHALRDRLEEVQLQPYNPEELAQIIEHVIDGETRVETRLMEKISSYVRRNGRSAQGIAKNILSFNSPVFTESHWESMVKQLNLMPHGVSADEVRALQILEKDGECSLGHLSCRLGKPARATQKEVEPYPISLGFLEIEGKRRITAKGRQFLKELAKNQ